jgi:hypothetical protein
MKTSFTKIIFPKMISIGFANTNYFKKDVNSHLNQRIAVLSQRLAFFFESADLIVSYQSIPKNIILLADQRYETVKRFVIVIIQIVTVALQIPCYRQLKAS